MACNLRRPRRRGQWAIEDVPAGDQHQVKTGLLASRRAAPVEGNPLDHGVQRRSYRIANDGTMTHPFHEPCASPPMIARLTIPSASVRACSRERASVTAPHASACRRRSGRAATTVRAAAHSRRKAPDGCRGRPGSLNARRRAAGSRATRLEQSSIIQKVAKVASTSVRIRQRVVLWGRWVRSCRRSATMSTGRPPNPTMDGFWLSRCRSWKS